jgi:carbonic anhydrase/acetyltransferase-like protein (isoleucine patch superfamily)
MSIVADAAAPVVVGAYCSLADGVRFQLHRGGRIVVGNDVWIGRGAVIHGGVTIGDGAVVGTRAVVTQDVRPYAIVAGDPACERRRRFGDEQVAALLQIAWWTWPEERIRAHAALLCAGDVGAFLAAATGSG